MKQCHTEVVEMFNYILNVLVCYNRELDYIILNSPKQIQ